MKQHERKAGENDKKEEMKYSEEIIALQTRTRILESRAQRFEVKAVQKYQELQRILNKDRRLAALHEND